MSRRTFLKLLFALWLVPAANACADFQVAPIELATKSSDFWDSQALQLQAVPIMAFSESETDDFWNPVTPAAYQPQPLLQPQMSVIPPTPAAPTAGPLNASFTTGAVRRSLLGSPSSLGGPLIDSQDLTAGEVQGRAATDAGSILGKSPAFIGLGVQKRSPIVTDPRIRGSRVGQLAASGSHWVPARIDLDTAVNKIDARNLSSISVVRGPYSVLFGPGFQFVDMTLMRSPRYDDGPHLNASTSLDYKTNGQQFFGRQSVWGGGTQGGYRLSYGNSTGNDYFSGNGTFMPSSYSSQEFDSAWGADLTPDSYLEFNYLLLDQNNLLLPGQVFDIDHLTTNSFELEYGLVNQSYFDRMTLKIWNNDTNFNGDAQRASKRVFFPYLNLINYVGTTKVASASTGYTLAFSWNDDDNWTRTAGTDLRLVNQQLNEIGSGSTQGNTFTNANSPIPRSYTLDNGVFLEESRKLTDRFRVVIGGRADWVHADITASPSTLAAVGNYPTGSQPTYADIVGASDFAQNFSMQAAYLTAFYDLNEHWTLTAAGGTSQRAPNSTELYAAQPFMALIQNGLNTVTGNPNLKAERLVQTDLAISCKFDRFHASLSGFQSWGFDYITFENIGVVYGPGPTPEQVNLKYVNTKLATFVGADAAFQYDYNDWISPFGTLTYVDGRDRTRNGDTTTNPVMVNPPVIMPSTQVPGTRGAASGIVGSAQEPLPNILPLMSRVGVRLHSAGPTPTWGLEIGPRIVNHQYRVATSLLETTTGGFTVWDLRGTWQARRNLRLQGGIENFTNRNYREHLDFRSFNMQQSMLQPGIAYYFGGEVTY
jgi:iron complex outermembrane recepter protein